MTSGTWSNRGATASRLMGVAARSRAHRSPTDASRASIVRSVKARGSSAGVTSSQASGVDTPAHVLARALYAVASVLAREFCKKST